MKSIWNLILGSVLLFTIIIDYIFQRIDGVTIISSILVGLNFMYYIADKILKQEVVKE